MIEADVEGALGDDYGEMGIVKIMEAFVRILVKLIRNGASAFLANEAYVLSKCGAVDV
jgi:hypothetical protein